MKNRDQLACDNHAFFCVAVAMALCGPGFKEALRVSTWEENNISQLPLTKPPYNGYIRVDSSDVVRNCSHGSLCEDRTLPGKVALQLPKTIGGEMNTEAIVTCDRYVFHFKITQYERDGDHGYEMTENPLSLPKDEELGRLVELKITVA